MGRGLGEGEVGPEVTLAAFPQRAEG